MSPILGAVKATLAKLLGRLEVRFMDMVYIYIILYNYIWYVWYIYIYIYIYIFGDGFTKQLLLQMGGTNL